jgi:hypothetical protein
MTPAEVKAALDDSRKWEGRAKANKAKADQLDQLTASQQSAEEKAAAAAARADRLAGQFVTAELKAALTGIVPDAAAVVGTLNHALYVTADGEIDADKVAALQATYRALAVPSGPRAPAPNPAQGNGTRQLTLTEMVAELERKPGRSREEQRELGRLKARQLAQIRQGQA